MRRSPLRRPGVLVMASLGLVAVVALALPVAAGSAQLAWNVTPSAPAGLYRIVREPWSRGDRVAVLPGEALGADLDRRGILAKGRLLIKRAAGVGGDRVCRQGAEVSINDNPAGKARDVDSQGLPLPSWQGCVTLGAAQVFLLGDTAGSYDGRYFGVTSKAEIVGQAVLVHAF